VGEWLRLKMLNNKNVTNDDDGPKKQPIAWTDSSQRKKN
jgi:hypothetical protein